MLRAAPLVFALSLLLAAQSEAAVRVEQLEIDTIEFRGERWRHTIAVAWREPLAVKDHALVIVGNGSAGEPLPAGDRDRIVALAERAGMPVALVRQIPNQPILGGKSEDEAIAHTLAEFFRTGDASWPLLRPMTAAASGALDALAAFGRRTWGVETRGFTMSGESKRGWTTWLTAAADPRIKALAPVVFDVLSIRAQLKHQLASWGAYSEQLGDYSERGLPAMLGTPAGARLLAIVDPIQHAARLTQPKLVVLGTNDRYWPLDAASLYWGRLRGPKYALYLAREGHEFRDKTKLDDGLVALARAAAGQARLPRLEFAPARGDGGVRWRIDSDVAPVEARVWRAVAPTRDFRDAAWRDVRLVAPARRFVAGAASEAQGFTASFVELRYDIGGLPLHLTTTTVIAKADGTIVTP